ncbi:DUF554 domain-containing protein [Ornithinimicrobium ciconiae]|uniref:DUF554 domain-containing protein n=1 Tax=Ornithinimicrobium ciconiae TaxID=2594265 RepID=A0A516GBH6_9MICO|nr:DUF554 domain-containing protein [Ornithinimicrobium ciconiae]QDO88869.1 DUF554 domain-containing protein [Ornithinimicrobium ciconiae]
MDQLFPGAGTALNVLTVLVGSLLGMVFGHRLSEHTRSVVTDCLGLVTFLVAILSLLDVTSPALVEHVGSGVPVLIVLGALLIGGITGSLLRIEQRVESLAGVIQAFVARRTPAVANLDTAADETPGWQDGSEAASASARERFIEGWLTASLLFCVGPLAILGSLNDGLGRGIDELALKSVLDGFAALAFAASFGLGVIFSAVSVAVVQGGLTLVGVLLGSLVPEAHIAALTAVGGLLLIGISLRLLRIRDLPVGDLLPALAVAPVLVWIVGSLT